MQHKINRTSLALLLCSVSLAQTGFNQTGGCHLVGPNGLDVHGAYQFRDMCTSSPQPGLAVCWQIKVVMSEPVRGWKPDLWSTEQVEVWGDALGHFTLRAGPWTVEMVAIEETIRQQVAWEAEAMGWKHADSGTQRIDVTVGRDTILITGSR